MAEMKKIKVQGTTYDIGGGGGTSDHTQLTNRDASNQHPMSAITGLENALDSKGTYSKPSGGIPKTDLASAVQTSLGKADTALQEHQSLADYSTTAQMNAAISAHHDNTKQDVISDLDDIRSGAALGATALQAVPNTYRTASAQDVIDNGKVDKVTGKGLSTNDYTNEDKAKVASAVQPDDLDDYALKTDLDDYAKTEDVPTQLAQLTSDSTHRVVTDAEKSTWNGKSDVVISSVSNITPTQVATAISQGKTVVITVSDDVDFGSLSFEAWNVSTSFGRVISNTTARLFNSWVTISLQGNLSTDSWELVGGNIASLQDVDGKVDISQGVSHSGEFLVVGDDGNVTTMTLTEWQGGSY